jgi:hypothetical protein
MISDINWLMSAENANVSASPAMAVSQRLIDDEKELWRPALR